MAPRDQLLFGAAGAAFLAALLGAWLLVAPPASGEPATDGTVDLGFAASGAAAPTPSEDESLLVDVEGGVAQPGIVELGSGTRVGDAIAAAGGYSNDADVLAAAAALNLAAPLTDGQQVYVPIVGVAHGAPDGDGSGGGGVGGGGSTGLVNVNSATPEQLDALPGIGPVTVQKIVAARQEQPFATLEELVERKVLNNGQLEKVRDLVTV